MSTKCILRLVAQNNYSSKAVDFPPNVYFSLEGQSKEIDQVRVSSEQLIGRLCARIEVCMRCAYNGALTCLYGRDRCGWRRRRCHNGYDESEDFQSVCGTCMVI